ncbi:RusA family crossover junction endodeoxyribonuclease [Nonomuraea sp. NPDC059023]|uniref:RusA family crossover junction endodeoxyribonuclease n=1 Tax=unclassified Nonomuraea TaxID=2593643 RepID=UPI003692D551
MAWGVAEVLAELSGARDGLAAHASVCPLPLAQRCPRCLLHVLAVLGNAPSIGEPELTVVVYGTPGPQGSKKAHAIYRGRGSERAFTGKVALAESSAKVKPWRACVDAAARRAAAAAAAARGLPDWQPLDGPLVAQFVFSLPRGSSVKRSHHTVYPDLSKLIRSTEDAFTTAKIWADDARLVGYYEPRKLYAGDVGALDQPGAVIRVWRVP